MPTFKKSTPKFCGVVDLAISKNAYAAVFGPEGLPPVIDIHDAQPMHTEKCLSVFDVAVAVRATMLELIADSGERQFIRRSNAVWSDDPKYAAHGDLITVDIRLQR